MIKYLFVLILLAGCGFKPMGNCLEFQKLKFAKNMKDCVENPYIGFKKEF